VGVYDEFLERKQNGEKLDINTLTREQLKAMWHDEIIFDRDIAKLFDVTEHRVKTLRRHMNLMMNDILMEERMKMIAAWKDVAEKMDSPLDSLSKKDKEQFARFIDELSNWNKNNK